MRLFSKLTKIWEIFIYVAACVMVAVAFFVDWRQGNDREWVLDAALGMLIVILMVLLTQRFTAIQRIEDATKSRSSGIRFYSTTREAPSFLDYMNTVKKEMFLVGPSRAEVQRNYKRQVLELAKNSQVNILIMNPNSQSVSILGTFADPSVQPNQTLLASDLNIGKQTFAQWMQEASRQHLRLNVKAYDFIPFNVSFYDPQTAHGKLLMITIPWQTPPEERPCVEIERSSNEELFDRLYQRYMDLFENTAQPILK